MENLLWFCFSQVLLHFIHSHFGLLPAVSEIVLIALLFVAPITPMSDRALQSDFVVNPLEPTCIGRHEAFQPLLQHCPSSSSYFDFFLLWASSICSSNVTFYSHITIFFNLFEKNIRPGCKDVFTICSRNINLITTLTLNSQFVVGDRMFGLGFFILLGFMPCQKKCQLHVDLFETTFLQTGWLQQ